MSLPEKKHIEHSIAVLFLGLYNQRKGTNYEINELQDTPDVTCVDQNTGDFLELEITLLQGLPDEIKHVLGRDKKPISPTTGTTVVSYDDILDQLKIRLDEKLLSSYGPNTALVLRQVSILWEPKEWKAVADQFREEILKGKEQYYGRGVWIICTDNDSWPVKDTLFCLSNPLSK